MEIELSSEVGAAGRLFKSCIDLYWALIHRVLSLEYKRQQKQALRTEFGRFYFWGDGFYPYEGRLDEILSNSSRLRNRVLSILVEVGEILCNERTGLYGLVSRAVDDGRLRIQRLEVRALIEGIRETLDDAVSSGSESDSGSDVSDQGNLLHEIIHCLRARNQCLIDLSGSLERPAADADLEEVGATDTVTFKVSGPAEIWTRKIMDTFPSIDTTLAERFGEANWQRYQRVCKKLEQAEPFEEGEQSEDESNDEESEDDKLGALPEFTGTTKSSADPSSIFSSIGKKTATTSTSVSGPNFDYAFPRARPRRLVKDLRSQATYTSVVSKDQGERGWLKIPSMPRETNSGKAFRCTVCGDSQNDIFNWTEWKKHVFTDLQPYICTFANCKAGLASYMTRKLWAHHEFSVHRKNKVWVCSDCTAEFHYKDDMREHAYSSHGYVLMRNQLETLINAAERSAGVTENNKCPFCFEMPGIKNRAFVMHVGRHMEEIALAVLPRDAEFEEDRESTSSDHSATANLDEEDEDILEKEKAGLTKGLPPGWKLKRTDSGRAYSTNRAGGIFWGETPSLSREEWELEFCHALVVEFLKPDFYDSISSFTEKRFTQSGVEKSQFTTSLIEIEENLRRKAYSNAEEFREEMLKLEHNFMELNNTNEFPSIARVNFRSTFDIKWRQMDRWLRINGANWSKEDPKPAEHTISSAVQPDVTQEQAGLQSKSPYTTIDQFHFVATLGKGKFSKVILAESKSNQQLYAIKILKKEFVIENDEVKGTKTEKNVFVKAREHNHPFIARLISTFQSSTRLYFVTEYLPGGDLMHHIQKEKFDLTRARFYGAEFCLVLKFLHENGIIYRGGKLDNIMLTSEGHIQVIGFGMSAEGMDDHYATTRSFSGTAEFLAPEILLDRGYGRAVDWWAFGVLMYQMLLQQSPFRGEDEDEIYDAILADEPLYPISMPPSAVNLIQKLLMRDPEQRLGYHQGAQEIMNHDFFTMIDWEALYRKEVTPPFRPMITDKDDVRNFDTEFTSKAPFLTPVQSVLTLAMQEEFSGFSLSNT